MAASASPRQPGRRKAESFMPRRCHIDGCARDVLPALAAEGVCLDHFVEIVVARADQVRAHCLEAEPVEEEVLDWLFGDAPHMVRVLANGGTEHDISESDRILEILLCLANLQDYISHHSFRLKPNPLKRIH